MPIRSAWCSSIVPGRLVKEKPCDFIGCCTYVGSISAAFSSPVFFPPLNSGEVCGLLSRTAAGNRAYMYVALCVAFCQDIHDANITTIATIHPLFVDRYGYVVMSLCRLCEKRPRAC